MSFIWLVTGLRMNNIERKFLKYLIPPLLSLIHFWHKSSRQLFHGIFSYTGKILLQRGSR